MPVDRHRARDALLPPAAGPQSCAAFRPY